MMATDKATENRDEYNGWTNRETWAVSLHLNNTEWLQAEAMLAIVDPHNTERAEDILADFVDSLFTDYFEGESIDPATIASMIRDCGSLWRVNWREIADAMLED